MSSRSLQLEESHKIASTARSSENGAINRLEARVSPIARANIVQSSQRQYFSSSPQETTRRSEVSSSASLRERLPNGMPGFFSSTDYGTFQNPPPLLGPFPFPMGQQPGLFPGLFQPPSAQTLLPDSIQGFSPGASSTTHRQTMVEDSAPGKAQKPRRRGRRLDAARETKTREIDSTFFTCINCSKPQTFVNSRSFSTHCRTEHPTEQIKCSFPNCSSEYELFRSLIAHITDKHFCPDRYRCGFTDPQTGQVCMYKSPRLWDARTHFLSVHHNICNREEMARRIHKREVVDSLEDDPENPDCKRYTCTLHPN